MRKFLMFLWIRLTNILFAYAFTAVAITTILFAMLPIAWIAGSGFNPFTSGHFLESIWAVTKILGSVCAFIYLICPTSAWVFWYKEIKRAFNNRTDT